MNYTNSFAIFSVLVVAIIFQLMIKRKINAMFEVNDIKTELQSIGSVLLIIAHPGDEIMYWSPTIESLIFQKIPMKILCLSNGNANGLGELREKEFDDVSRELNFPDSIVLNIPELQDNKNQKWDPSIISQQIEEYLNYNQDVKTILTFDKSGVNKHPNHISCYDGLNYYLEYHKGDCKAKGIRAYTLDSFNFLLEYNYIVPFLTALFKSYGYFSFYFALSYRWMRLYGSQFNIFRKVHVFLSSYSYFNSYNKLDY